MGTVTLKDTRLGDYTLDNLPRLRQLRQESFDRRSEICIERAYHVTRYLRDLDDPADDPEVRQAKKVRYFLEHKQPLFHDINLLAGSTTSKPLGAPLFPEFFATTLWPELDTVGKRPKNPQLLSKEDARILNFEILPFWMERNVIEVARKRYNNPKCQQLFEQLSYFIAGKAGCVSHCVPTYAAMLENGLRGICEEASRREASLASAKDDESRHQLAFYQAVRIALEGIMTYATHVAEYAEAQASKASDSKARRELREMASVCRRVPAHGATSFREAVNALWLCQVGIHAENMNMAMSPGRLDQVLYPYYRKDMDSGRIDMEKALELVGCLWLKLADNVNMVPATSQEMFGGAGTVPAVTLGGVDSRGEDAVNDLTYLMLRVTELLRVRDPNVNARYHYVKNSSDYLRRVSEVIVSTKAVPALYNDVANIAALEGQGEKPEHARDYGIVGCVELAGTGRDYLASSSVMLNLAAPLEMALFGGKRPISGNTQIGPQTPDPSTLKSFDQFWDVFTTQLDWLIDKAVQFNEYLGKVHQDVMPSPLLSAFFEGPMEKGRDLIWGGALYNSSGATHIGFADIVDSLSAIQSIIFEGGKYAFSDLIAAIKADFKGTDYEKMRTYLHNYTPRYGTEDETAMTNSRKLIDHLFERYQSYTNYRGGHYRPGYWTMTNHAGLGGICGAMPYGRLSGQVMASGITPVSGAAAELTPCLRAVASLAGAHVPGGWALNLKYTPEKDTGKMVERFANVVEGYFKEGGHQVQFNVMTYETLIDAKEHPEKYPELMVRVSGYSAYFKDLNEMMKNELISRTQYDLETGGAVPLADREQYLSQSDSGSRGILGWLVSKVMGALSSLLQNTLDSKDVQGIVRFLLGVMQLAFRLSESYRANIKDFNGRYLLLSKDGALKLAIIFQDGKMLVKEEVIQDPHITLTFSDGLALLKLLSSAHPDVMGAMLHHEVETRGNLNYLFKLAYMALQLVPSLP